jgi:hypothetical protein
MSLLICISQMLLAMLDQFVSMLLRHGLLPPDVAVDTGNLEQEASDLFLKWQMTYALLVEQAGNTHTEMKIQYTLYEMTDPALRIGQGGQSEHLSPPG